MRRHEYDQRLAKVAGYVLKDKRIIRIDDYEHGSTCERIQIARIEAVILLVRFAATRQSAAIDAIAFHAGGQAAQLVAIWKDEKITSDMVCKESRHWLLTVLGMLGGGETAIR